MTMQPPRFSVLLAALFAIAVALSACSPAAPPTAGTPAGSTPAAAQTPDAAQTTVATAAPTTQQAATAETVATAEPEATAQPIGKANANELHVLNWEAYGSDEDWAVEQFEAANGVKVIHDYYTSLDEMLEKLRANPDHYDVIQMNISYIQPAVEDGLLQAIDTNEIETWITLPEEFRSLTEVTQGTENVYAIPWTWGATSLVYNADTFPEGVTSLDVLWDPQNAGKVSVSAFYEDAMILAALKEGIENPANPAEADLPAIQASLAQLVPNVKGYWEGEEDFTTMFEGGDITLGVYWSGSTARAQNDLNLPIQFTIPEEGAIGWIDTWTISSQSPNTEMATKWINFINSPEFYLRWDSAKGAPVPANILTLGQLPEDSFARRVFDQPDIISRLAFQTYIPEEKRTMLNEMWEEVKAQATK
jgi:spermidine/putrescine transport system substrate-binding protein